MEKTFEPHYQRMVSYYELQYAGDQNTEEKEDFRESIDICLKEALGDEFSKQFKDTKTEQLLAKLLSYDRLTQLDNDAIEKIYKQATNSINRNDNKLPFIILII
jgi:hypothetical protein